MWDARNRGFGRNAFIINDPDWGVTMGVSDGGGLENEMTGNEWTGSREASTLFPRMTKSLGMMMVGVV